MADTEYTIEQFIAAHRITSKATLVDRNPNMDDERMDHWRVTLKWPPGRMTVYFSKGMGHHGVEPATSEVLDCIASDSASYENDTDFEEWASNFGYDTDSRTAKRTFEAVKRQSDRLKHWIGNQYDSLLWDVSRN